LVGNLIDFIEGAFDVVVEMELILCGFKEETLAVLVLGPLG
jgi:hypothetical protein